jgi:hypothetical protein
MVREKNKQRDLESANYENLLKRAKKEIIDKTLEN